VAGIGKQKCDFALEFTVSVTVLSLQIIYVPCVGQFVGKAYVTVISRVTVVVRVTTAETVSA